MEAKELLYTSISKPLIEAGYHVISPNLAMDILKKMGKCYRKICGTA